MVKEIPHKGVLSATVARIADVVVTPGDNGAEGTVSYIFDFGSLQSITDMILRGKACGPWIEFCHCNLIDDPL